MGRAPGHKSLLVPDSTPAPGSYNVEKTCFDSRRKQSTAVSLDCSGRERASAEERALFRKADKNSDGSLDFKEITTLMKARFPAISVSDIRTIMNAADQNHDGKVDFQELVAYTHSTNPAGRMLRDKFLMALASPGDSQSYREGQERLQFRRADLNYDGHLDASEVEALMRSCFNDIKKRDVNSIFQAMDRDLDGKIDFHEVIEYTRSKDPSQSRLREKFVEALAMPRKDVSESNSKLKGPRRPARSASASAVGSLIARRANSA